MSVKNVVDSIVFPPAKKKERISLFASQNSYTYLHRAKCVEKKIRLWKICVFFLLFVSLCLLPSGWGPLESKWMWLNWCSSSAGEKKVQARATFYPLTGKGDVVNMCYRTLYIGTGKTLLILRILLLMTQFDSVNWQFPRLPSFIVFWIVFSNFNTIGSTFIYYPGIFV